MQEILDKWGIKSSELAKQTVSSMQEFNSCIDIEKEGQPKADKFYRSRGATNITRWNWDDTEHGQYMQQDDIDATVEFYNAFSILDASKKAIDISEKFRTRDFGDHMIEIWSNYQKKNPGSHIKCEADWLEQFVPGGVYEVTNASALRTLATYARDYFDWDSLFTTLKPQFPSEPMTFIYKGNTYNVKLYKGVSTRGDNHWNNLCMIVSWDDLAHMGIPSKFYHIS